MKPKKSKFLAIPLPDAYRGRSVADPPRSYPNTFVLATKKKGSFGGLFIVQDTGGGGEKFNFLFQLKRSVKLEPRLGMRDTMRKTLDQKFKAQVIRALENAAGKAFS